MDGWMDGWTKASGPDTYIIDIYLTDQDTDMLYIYYGSATQFYPLLTKPICFSPENISLLLMTLAFTFSFPQLYGVYKGRTNLGNTPPPDLKKVRTKGKKREN